MSKNRLGGKRDKSSADISVVRLTLHIYGSEGRARGRQALQEADYMS